MYKESEIREGLETTVFGQGEIHIYTETDSTNNKAYSLAEDLSPEGTIVLAEYQNAGRGRMGRTWVSVPGKSISLSIILRPPVTPDSAPGITLVMAVALSDTLREFGIHNHSIKWPNDILINNRKISGILTELKMYGSRIGFVIAGMGINTGPVKDSLPEELKPFASSIYDETGISIERLPFLRKLLKNIEAAYFDYLKSGLDALLPRWRDNSDIFGKRVSALKEGEAVEGTVRGICGDGSLEIETADGEVKITSGEITLL